MRGVRALGGVLGLWALAAAILAPVPAPASEDESPIAGTVWRWSRVLGIDPVEVEHPIRYTLELQADGSYAVRADCNRAGGRYTLEGDALELAPGPATLAECGEESHAARFLALLSDVRGWGLEGERLLLTLAGDAGTLELAAAREVALPGTTWLVRAHHDGGSAVVSALAGASPTLVFGSDGQLAGTAGCNRYSAAYGLEDGGISIGPTATTRRACSEPEGVMEREAAFLAALAAASRWRVEGERLRLRREDGALAVDAVAAVTGSVTYRVRRALPPDAEVAVRLEDVSRADAPAELLGEQRFRADGRQVPLPFEIVFDPSRIEPRMRYALRARITDASGRTLFLTTRSFPTLTHDHPSFGVEVVLDPAPVRPGP